MNGAGVIGDARPILSLTGLRGLCCLLVVLYHYKNNVWVPGWIDGGIPVSMFFTLSGYLMAHVYTTVPLPPRAFWVKRIARIAPLYYLGLILYSYRLVGELYRHPNDVMMWVSAISSVLGLQSLVPLMPFWMSVGWSLSVEVVAYVLFPFLPSGAGFVGLTWLVCAYLPVLGVLLLPPQLQFLVYYHAAFRVWEFVLAAVTTKMILAHDFHVSKNYIDVAPLMWLAFVLGLPYVPHTETVQLLFHNGWLSMLNFCVVVCIREESSWVGWLLSTRFFTWAGEISFSAYVIHMMCEKIVLDLFDHEADRDPLHHLSYLALYLLLVLGASQLVHICFEKPASKCLSKGLASPTTTANSS